MVDQVSLREVDRPDLTRSEFCVGGSESWSVRRLHQCLQRSQSMSATAGQPDGSESISAVRREPWQAGADRQPKTFIERHYASVDTRWHLSIDANPLHPIFWGRPAYFDRRL